MKNLFDKTPYCKHYKDILKSTDKITFEQFIKLRKLEMLDPRSVHFTMSDGDDFGYFEIEKNIPEYRYHMFFDYHPK
jgi:hypothetical protein